MQSMNKMTLTKWVDIVSPWYNPTILVLWENYDRGLNRESRVALIKGTLPFWQGSRQIFPHIHDFSLPSYRMDQHCNIGWMPGHY